MPVRPRQWAWIVAGGSLVGGCPPPPPAGPSDAVDAAVVAGGLTAPVALIEAPEHSGRLWVADQVGLIRVIEAGQLRDGAALDLRDRMVALAPGYDERGLLGLAAHPKFAENGRLFVFYSAPDPAGAFDSLMRLSEWRVDAAGATVDPGTERILLEIGKPQPNHNGGQLAFGPDGFLYIAVGDGGGAGDVGTGHTPGLGNAQDLTTLLGKILRINVDEGDPYGVPDDNPFSRRDAVRSEIFAYGLRNPWRFSFDVQDGVTTLWAADVGQRLREEINWIESGGNYGWNIREGGACFDASAPLTAPGDCPDVAENGVPLRGPVLEYLHEQDGQPVGSAVIGGFVYRGAALPQLQGAYVFGDFSAGLGPDGRLFVARPDEGGIWQRRELTLAQGRRLGRYLLSLGRDSAGELYLLTSQSPGPSGQTGEVWRLTD